MVFFEDIVKAVCVCATQAAICFLLIVRQKIGLISKILKLYLCRGLMP